MFSSAIELHTLCNYQWSLYSLYISAFSKYYIFKITYQVLEKSESDKKAESEEGNRNEGEGTEDGAASNKAEGKVEASEDKASSEEKVIESLFSFYPALLSHNQVF